ncbi:DUF2574 family protein [Citrobacter amalonaticus]|uniref:DUF2574 family protein n=1 Tax=Citrobacter amalonaticus TaxID=35703 RepID=UPI00339D1473
MKNYLRSGILVLVYAMSSPAFSSDTAMLSISGRVVSPSCSTDMVNAQLQQRCGNAVHSFTAQEGGGTFAQGVVTEVVAVAGDTSRRIILNSYD